MSVDDVADPSETDGYEIALDKACPTVLHYTEDDDDKYCLSKDGKLEAGRFIHKTYNYCCHPTLIRVHGALLWTVTIKVLFNKDASDAIRAVRIELLSDHDLFFCYTGNTFIINSRMCTQMCSPKIFAHICSHNPRSWIYVSETAANVHHRL